MKRLCGTLGLILFASGAMAGEPVRPFDGTDLAGWKPRDKNKNTWVVGRCNLNDKDNSKLDVRIIPPQADGGPGVREMIVPKPGTDIYTEAKFGDCVVEVEVMIPKGSNSGIYLMGEYEVQVFDSFGKEKLGPGDMGGIYNHAAPKVNACKKPGEWQKFIIEFQAPKFENGKKVANAKFVKVTLNDQVIHENVEALKPTTACLTGKESPTGPLMFQGDHGPVAYRNLVIKPIEK
jgi:hypothetical protein